ncbi:MAG: YihY/virulence factor BrkB family protein [Pseudomonadota bacterium]
MNFLKSAYRVTMDAFWQFNADDGWAISSHIALSTLMAMFPFFLVLTALAGVFGSQYLADEAANLVLEAWPEEVAGPISREIHNVLVGAHGQVLTVGALLALYFASSGIESLRIGLNRAYTVVETRSIWLLRLESIGYVILAAVGLLALSFLVLLAPLIWTTLVRRFPALEPFGYVVTFVRLATATVLLIVPLFVVHKWLPAGKRRLLEILPGILVTLALWLITGIAFGRYLADFAFTYSVYYAGLASPMIALVFLYWTASIFIYGGELNATISKKRAESRSGTVSPV